jgi:putative membrane protein
MMFDGLCHAGAGNWGSVGNFGIWGWIGLILNLVFWVALIAGLVLLVVWAIRRARVPAATGPQVTGRPTAKEILQAKYAGGEITREQYQLMKQDIA